MNSRPNTAGGRAVRAACRHATIAIEAETTADGKADSAGARCRLLFCCASSRREPARRSLARALRRALPGQTGRRTLSLEAALKTGWSASSVRSSFRLRLQPELDQPAMASESKLDQAASATARGIAAVIACRRCARNAIVTFRLSRRAVRVLARIGYVGSDLSKTRTRSSSA